jgi:putative transposase
VAHVRAKLGVSERRACRVLKQPRSTQRHVQRVPPDEPVLRSRVVALASEYGRYGYGRITALLRWEGWLVNTKRVERIWRQEGLKVPRKQPKRARLWLNDGSCVRLRATHKDHVWAYDIVIGWTHDGRPIKLLTLVDEYARECIAVDVARRMTSQHLLARLAELMVYRGVPDHIRSDNGPEYTALAVRDWLGRVGVKSLFIEPESPWENGYCVSSNGKLRDELLNREIFYTLRKAQIVIEGWRRRYNTIRPHSSLGYRPPAPQATLPFPPASASLRREETASPDAHRLT